MSRANPIDAHLRKFSGAQRDSLEKLTAILREELPGAEECISYGMPCFKVNGKAVAHIDGFKAHNSYFPGSATISSVVGALPMGYVTTKGGIKFPPDTCPTRTLVRRLVKARLREIEERGR